MEKIKTKSFKCYLTLANLSVFVSSANLQIIGFVYLIKMNYQFTFFSINLLAAFAILVGFFSASLNILNNISIKRSNLKLSLYSVILIQSLYIILLIVSICSMNLNSNITRIKESMYKMMQSYDEKNLNKFETKMFDWLHEKYNCCGVESHEDWKFLLINNNRSINYINYLKINENQTLYYDDVPDSCCAIRVFHCGKQLISTATSKIHMNGCSKSYINEHQIGINVMGKTSLAFSIITLFFMLILYCKIYGSIKEPYNGLQQNDQ